MTDLVRGLPIVRKGLLLGRARVDEEATRLNGGLDPVVQETECLCEGGEGCRFDIRWG